MANKQWHIDKMPLYNEPGVIIEMNGVPVMTRHARADQELIDRIGTVDTKKLTFLPVARRRAPVIFTPRECVQCGKSFGLMPKKAYIVHELCPEHYAVFLTDPTPYEKRAYLYHASSRAVKTEPAARARRRKEQIRKGVELLQAKARVVRAKKRIEQALGIDKIDPEHVAKLAEQGAAAVARALDVPGVEPAQTPAAPEMPKVTVEEGVRRELAARELARRKLLKFVLRRFPAYQAGWFHIDLCERLEKFVQAIIRGESPRLLIEVPPRHGKSTLVSENLPPWFMGLMPNAEIIAASYSSSLAFDFSRKVQDIIRDPDYAVLFPGLTLKEGAESIERWKTNKDGAYLAAGVGGPVTGRGAHMLLIDDPIKNREDADSLPARNVVWNWYTSTAYTRLAPGGGICVIHTRWHQDDLIGRLREQMREGQKIFESTGVWPEDYDRWEVVSYPAVATEREAHRDIGEPLHRERYNLGALLRIKRTLGPRDWAALYQQNPVPETGAYFEKESIKYYDGDAPDGRVFITGDLAISTKTYSDYTVFIVFRITETEDIYVTDVRRGKWNAAEVVDELFRLQALYKPYTIGLEQGQIELALEPLILKMQREKKLYDMVIEKLPVRNRDKEARARPIQGRMTQGKVFFPRNAMWLDWFMQEVLSFPHGRHDDCVDALAHAGQLMNDVNYVPPPKPSKPPSWRDKLDKYLAKSDLGGRNPAMGN